MTCLVGVGGCTNLAAESPAEQQAILSRVSAGTVTLDCTFTCSADFIFQQQRIYTAYSAGDWPALAVAVTKTEFRMDVTYYLLGVAAQGMGQHAAAIKYFRYAGALATDNRPVDHCRQHGTLCNGIRLPDDLYPRIRLSEAALVVEARPTTAVRRPMAPTATATAAAPASPASVAATSSAWIDPPPAQR